MLTSSREYLFAETLNLNRTKVDATGRVGGDGDGSDERRLGLAAVAHVALEALALAGRVVALAAATALERVVVAGVEGRGATMRSLASFLMRRSTAGPLA